MLLLGSGFLLIAALYSLLFFCYFKAFPAIDSSVGSLKADSVSPLSSASYLSRGEGSYTFGFFASSISRALIESAIVLGGEPVPIS